MIMIALNAWSNHPTEIVGKVVALPLAFAFFFLAIGGTKEKLPRGVVVVFWMIPFSAAGMWNSQGCFLASFALIAYLPDLLGFFFKGEQSSENS
jgi:hypothetical protein